MRILALTTTVLLSCTLGPALAGQVENAPVRLAQAAVPVQPDQTPQQADKARAQDRKDSEDVQIKPGWKAQGGGEGGSLTGRADRSDQDHQTVGRDWRAHPDERK